MPLQHILYIDDEPDIQTIAKFALEEVGGFKVTLCSSGAEAIHWLESNSTDLILIDVMMPAMTGPETIAAARLKFAQKLPPFIFITAKIQEKEKEGYGELGCLAVVSKPFDPLKISEKLQRIYQENFQEMTGSVPEDPKR